MTWLSQTAGGGAKHSNLTTPASPDEEEHDNGSDSVLMAMPVAGYMETGEIDRSVGGRSGRDGRYDVKGPEISCGNTKLRVPLS